MRGLDCETVPDYVFEQLSDTKTPQGVLAVMDQFDHSLEDLIPENKNALLLVLESLQDPGNLGTMFRAAEAAGVTGILMDRNTVDPYNPKVVRSTMGSIFRVPFYIAQDFRETLKYLKTKQISVFAAHLDEDRSRSYEECDYKKPSAFLIGNEGNGLTGETKQLADQCIRIPMLGKVESLNAAMASVVLLFEAARQRRR